MDKKGSPPSTSSDDDRLEALDAFTRENPGAPVSDLIIELLVRDLDALDDYAAKHQGAPISNHVAQLFEQIARAHVARSALGGDVSPSSSISPGAWTERLSLERSSAGPAPRQPSADAPVGAASSPPWPSEAPTKWKDRMPGETAPDFTRRVYGAWLQGGAGIPKRALRALDAALINELNAWTRNGNEMPADIRLLTLKEENDLLLESLEKGEVSLSAHLDKFSEEEAARELHRLEGARGRRLGRG
jgi:hypothetical protein